MVRKFLSFCSEWKKRSTSESTPQFPNGISRKLPYHLTSNRNFWIFWPNGKHPLKFTRNANRIAQFSTILPLNMDHVVLHKYVATAHDVHINYFHGRQPPVCLRSWTQLNFAGKPAVNAWDRLRVAINVHICRSVVSGHVGGYALGMSAAYERTRLKKQSSLFPCCRSLGIFVARWIESTAVNLITNGKLQLSAYDNHRAPTRKFLSFRMFLLLSYFCVICDNVNNTLFFTFSCARTCRILSLECSL